MKILIAEDEYTTRLMVQVCLERWGYSVQSVADGKAAWDILKKKNPPHIVILDWEMPELSGIELCRKIKNINRNNPIHVILLTARDSDHDIVQGFDAGADDYITKPFNDNELRARIRVAERIVTIQSSLNTTLEELRGALNLVDVFQDYITVCKSCHKFVGDSGTWQKIEDFLQKQPDSRFIEAVCPACEDQG